MPDRLFRYVILILCLCGAAPVSAQQRGGESGLRRVLLAPEPAASSPLVRAAFELAGPQTLPSFSLEPYAALFVSRPFPRYVAEWSASTRAMLARAERELLQRARARTGIAVEAAAVAVATSPGTDTVVWLPPPPAARTVQRDENALAGLIGDHADLGLVVTGNGSLGGAWTRYRPCDPTLYFNCSPGMFPQLKPDVQFTVRVGGTISERIHVDVDYDQTREFDAANNLNVFYQGLPDEVLQRVEVGDVSLRLPASRWLTRGIPAGNFGFMASGQLGPVDFQTVFAQQRGDVTTREFKLGGGSQQGLVQDATLVLDDADYVSGQFFFLVPPSDLTGSPHLDVLSLRPTDAPAAARPAAGGVIELYRDERPGAGGSGQSAQVGYFLADAVPPGGGPRHTGSFRRLLPDQDYVVHASGLWLMLRSPLRADEALAVSFLTETGDTVGRIRAESAPPGVTPQLRLLRGPAATHQPGAATWDLEMHQVYRLDSSGDVDPATIDLSISLGEQAAGRTFRDVLGRTLTFLKIFGLDEDAPADRIDGAQVFQPARDMFGGGGGMGSPVSGSYVVFPTLRPFAVPAPLASERLDSDDLRAALGRDANDAIYDDPDPVNRASASRFRLNFAYRVRVEGLVQSFNLGAFGIREGSERLTLGARPLVRDVDYTIEYEIGLVTLLDAQNLFATNPDAEIRATWEQKPLFSIAPTSVFGASARYSLGSRGELNFVGLYQAEKNLMTRPQLGVEPGSAFLGGMSGRFDLGGAALDRVLGSLPGLRTERPSALTLNGEIAFSAPNQNRHGAAYLDDFEASDEVPLSVRRRDWVLGSRPQSPEADRGTLPFVLDAATAAPLVWQHDYMQDGGIRGALLPRTHIDRQINIIGNELPEPVMWLSFGRRPGDPAPPLPDPGDPRRWRSITTVLSTTGRDMTRSEYLEFYVRDAPGAPLALILDIGTVGEDAFHVDENGLTNGTYTDGRPWGLGVLDEEARLIDREVWGRDKDERGLWDQTCRAEPLATYELGDPRANCTRGNGMQDTEDLNGNGVLDADDGPYFRYVVELDQLSEYLVRDTAATGTPFRLYRIPLKSGVPVNGANEGTWRFIRHLRLTVAGEAPSMRTLTLARLRVVGSRWTKRDVHGIQRGMLSAEPGAGAFTAEVRVGPVSRLTDGASYSPPPGVIDQLQDPTQQFGGGGTEINEKSLRITYRDLEPGDRAEVYYRYPQQPRDLRVYRELRLWALPRAGEWGPGAGQELLIKVGTDPRNYYLFRTPLRPATGPRPASAADWQPEIVVDFARWMALKAEAERLLIERGPSAAGQDTVWSEDGAYAIVLEDRARAPNLAAVRELTFAIWNGGALPANGEVWLNELRVSEPDRQAGAAGNLSLDLLAGDFASANVSVANQGSLFRQLGDSPGYVGATDLIVNADARLDRFTPASWGLDLPLSVTHSRNVQNPSFLQQSDVAADRLAGLRESSSDATRVGVRLSRRTPVSNPVLGLLVEGAAVRLSYTRSNVQSLTTRSETGGVSGDVAWRRDVAPRTIPVLPGFLGAALRALAPSALEESDGFRRLVDTRLRWTPASLNFGTTYDDRLTRTFRYDRILSGPGDAAVPAIESPRRMLRNDATLALRPVAPLAASLTVASDRDVLAAERATTRRFEQDALRDARTSLGGIDLGWEMARVVGTAVTYRPDITRWLRAGWSYDNRYITDRNPSYLLIEVAGNDTSATLQRRFESARQMTRNVQLLPRTMVTSLGIDSTAVLGRLVRTVESIDVMWRGSLSSQFERETFAPPLQYQLGLGDFASFRTMGADTAVRAQQRDEFRADAGFALPLAARLEVGYHESDIESFDARGGTRTQAEVGWPKATLQWRSVPPPVWARGVVSTLTASVGVQRIEREARLGGLLDQVRGATELRVPVSFVLGMPRGFTAQYRGAWSIGETIDPTGNVENAGHQHDFTLAGSFQPPQAWRTRLNGPLSISLNYAEQQQHQCRYMPGFVQDEGCVAFLDVGSRTANARFESTISDIAVGLQMNYVWRQNQVGTHTGSSQFNLNLYGRFSFTAGQLPAAFR